MEHFSAKMCETFRYNRCPVARMVSEKIEKEDKNSGR